MPSWRDPPPPAAAPTPPTPAGWRVGPAPGTYRPRWPRLALAAAGALAALAAVVWVALWNRPTPPARVVVLHAAYAANLAVPPNPYGTNLARALAPGTGGTLTRAGAALPPDLDAGGDRCVVVVVAAHGGRDPGGAFLFPDDADTTGSTRVRLRALIDRLAALPAKTQKYLILDATEPAAYPDLGIVHNDFASAVIELNEAIAAVPNLAVLVSSGVDQRSWPFPERGMTAFGASLRDALAGAADLDGDRRVTGWELAEYTTSRVKAWASDQRAAFQEPLLLPCGGAGEARTRVMHIVGVRPGPAAPAPPTPFEPPAELERTWETYRALAGAVPPPEAYTPHLWRQFEAWALRHERHVLGDDAGGAAVVRTKLDDLRRRIEADRRLAVRPQTLALPAAVGDVSSPDPIPGVYRLGIARVAAPGLPAAERAKEWAKVRAETAADPEFARVEWASAFVQYVAADPARRLVGVPHVLALLDPLFAVRPAELHFLAMLAAHATPVDPASDLGPLLKRVLELRLRAERAAACVPDAGFAYGIDVHPWVRAAVQSADAARRPAEDLCFTTGPESWATALALAGEAGAGYDRAAARAADVRSLLKAWHGAAARLPAVSEWLVSARGGDRFARDAALRADLAGWDTVRHAAAGLRATALDPAAFAAPAADLASRVAALDRRLAAEADRLVAARPEFEGVVTPRADAVAWWHAADAVLTAPDVDPARRVNLLREYHRVSRQLLVTGRSRPESLPDVSADVTRDRAFDTARRRGAALLARLGPEPFAQSPGESFDAVAFRLNEFAFTSDGRASLAAAGARIGEGLAVADPRLLTAAGAAALKDDPFARQRRAGVADLLLTQAKRTVADHWYGGGNDPYYRRATEQLAAEAAKLSPPVAPDRSPFAALLRAAEDFPVRTDLAPRVVFTDEPTPSVRVAFAPVTGVSGRPGFVALGADGPFGGSSRRAVPVAAGDAVFTLAAPDATPILPVAQSGALRLAGFFRGRTSEQKADVERHPVPHAAAVTPPPTDPYAKLALRANPAVAARYATGSGSVAVVLDCSGSMRPNPDVPGDRGLYPLAVAALRDVLGELPAGVEVSVTTFGRRTPGARTPEDTIRPFVAPLTLPPPPGAGVDDIVARAAAVPVDDLYDRSPVVRAVLAACDSLKAAAGPFKAVVLISDGVDTRFPDDPAFAKRAVREVLRGGFAGGGIEFGVVALPVTAPDEVAAQKQFEAVTTFTPPGKFVPPAGAKELGRWLRAGTRARVRASVEPVDGGTVTPFDLPAVTTLPDAWSPVGLPPGRYRVRLDGFTREVRVRAGDRLFMDLTADAGRIDLRRHWFAASAAALARSGGAGPRLAVLKNEFNEGRMRVLAAIEPPPEPEPVVTAVPRGEVWFDITPAVPGAAPVGVRWRPAGDLPAPAWAIDAAGWPAGAGGKAPAATRVRAWWPADGAFPAAGEPWQRPATGWTSVGETRVAGGIAAIRSVTIETHRVDVGAVEPEPRTCLVVRLAHPPGKPAWVRPLGTPPAGSEIRCFTDADRVTCLFWWDGGPLSPDAANARVIAFEVVPRPDAAAIEVPNLPPRAAP
jgi:hypothetical protein